MDCCLRDQVAALQDVDHQIQMRMDCSLVAPAVDEENSSSLVMGLADAEYLPVALLALVPSTPQPWLRSVVPAAGAVVASVNAAACSCQLVRPVVELGKQRKTHQSLPTPPLTYCELAESIENCFAAGGMTSEQLALDAGTANCSTCPVP